MIEDLLDYHRIFNLENLLNAIKYGYTGSLSSVPLRLLRVDYAVMRRTNTLPQNAGKLHRSVRIPKGPSPMKVAGLLGKTGPAIATQLLLCRWAG